MALAQGYAMARHGLALVIPALFKEKRGDIVIPPVRPASRPSIRPSVTSHHCS